MAGNYWLTLGWAMLLSEDLDFLYQRWEGTLDALLRTAVARLLVPTFQLRVCACYTSLSNSGELRSGDLVSFGISPVTVTRRMAL